MKELVFCSCKDAEIASFKQSLRFEHEHAKVLKAL